MAEFNMYNLYSLMGHQYSNNQEQSQETQKYHDDKLERTIEAFRSFHKPSNKEEMEKFVNNVLQGRNYNQTLKFAGESMDFEFTDERVKVTLHSKYPDRDNRYFAYQK